MSSSESFNMIVDGDWRDDFPGSSTEICEDYLVSAFTASPKQLLEPLPDSDPSLSWTHPSSPIYPPAHEAYHPEIFAVASPNPIAHTPFDIHGHPLQTDRWPVPYYAPFLNHQDSRPMPTVIPTTHQPSATHGTGRSLIRNDLIGYSSAAVNGSLPAHHPFYSPEAQPHSNGSQVSIDQTIPFNSAMDIPYRELQPVPTSVVRSFSSIPSGLVQSIVSRFPSVQVPAVRRDSGGSRSVTSSRYHPVRTSSFPVQSVSPEEAVVHTCQWTMDDGTTCGAQITYTIVPQHLIIHDIKGMAHDDLIPCRWLGCRLRGDKKTMKRESIVRHVREKHLCYRRVST